MPISHPCPACVPRRLRWVCRVALLGGAGLGAWLPAGAADVFSITVTAGTSTNSSTGSASYTTAQQAFDGLRDASLVALAPTYTSSTPAVMLIDYRGLALSTAFPNSGPLLNLNIPKLGISQQFNGATREASRQLLRDYFKSGDALDRIMRTLAESSPVDPIAGNPASLQTRMVDGSYQRHFKLLASTLSGRALGQTLGHVAGAPAGPPIWLAAAGTDAPVLGDRAHELDSRSGAMAELDLARYSRAGLGSTVVSLSFSHAFATAPDRPLSVDGELNTAHTEGAKSYGGNLGLAYRLRLQDSWYLVPSVGAGVSASPDLGAAGSLVSAALTSAFRLVEQADYTLWMGNAVNFTKTVNTSLSGYQFNAGLHNVVFTNGLVLSLTPASLWQGHWLELSLADTRYTGSAVYDRRYDELGIALVKARRGGGGPATLRGELNLLNTTHSKGWGVKLQMTF